MNEEKKEKVGLFCGAFVRLPGYENTNAQLERSMKTFSNMDFDAYGLKLFSSTWYFPSVGRLNQDIM